MFTHKFGLFLGCLDFYSLKNSFINISLYEIFKVRMPIVLLANGDGEIRTHDPLLARQVLSQLSYAPIGPFGEWA